MLPQPQTLEAYRPLFKDPTPLLEVARSLCVEHGVPVAELTPPGGGSNILFRTGLGHIVKLFPPLWATDAQPERICLQSLSHLGLGIRLPELVAHGELDGWPWLIMTELPGTAAGEIWSELETVEQGDVAFALGRLLRRFHDPPPADVLDGPSWGDFLAHQRRGLVEQHRAWGLPAPLLDTLEAFVDAADFALLPGHTPVLLHADVTDEHILLEKRDGCWHITGLIDFADAMVGHAAYDLLAPVVTLGMNRNARRHLLLGFDVPESALTPGLSHALCALTVLHRFGRVPQSCARLPTWEAVVEAMWSF